MTLPRGVETDLKRDSAVASVAIGSNEKNKRNEKNDKIECAAAGTESNIARSCYGSVGSTTACAVSATRFDPTMKGKAYVEF